MSRRATRRELTETLASVSGLHTKAWRLAFANVRLWHIADVDLEAEHVCSAPLFRHRSARLQRARHQPRFRDIEPCSRSSCGRAGAEPHEDFLFSYRSALLWFFGMNVCHRSMDQGRSLPANTSIVLRTAVCSDALPDRAQGRGMGQRFHARCERWSSTA